MNTHSTYANLSDEERAGLDFEARAATIAELVSAAPSGIDFASPASVADTSRGGRSAFGGISSMKVEWTSTLRGPAHHVECALCGRRYDVDIPRRHALRWHLPTAWGGYQLNQTIDAMTGAIWPAAWMFR